MMPVLINSKDCECFLRNIWKYNTINAQERVYAVFLDNNSKRIDYKLVCKGRYSRCDIDPRIIVKQALKLNSNNIVLAHNHPCGDPNPSDGDITETKNLNNVLVALDIKLVDHIILTEDNYYSFKDEGLIQQVKKAG